MNPADNLWREKKRLLALAMKYKVKSDWGNPGRATCLLCGFEELAEGGLGYFLKMERHISEHIENGEIREEMLISHD